MCGIAGFISPLNEGEKSNRILAMTDMIAHRGPDDGQHYVDIDIALGFRRLAIIDLKSGRQPMNSHDGRYWIVFNGEIYNFKALRKQLLAKGHEFRTESDTEVLLRSFIEWGQDCLRHLSGMFGFAIWDTREKALFLAVDRLGIKPIYYHCRGDSLVFASEAKALFESGLVQREADYSTLPFHMTFLTAPFPRTMFKGVHKLEPGHFIQFKNGDLQIKKYWDCVPVGTKTKCSDSAPHRVAEEVRKAVIGQSISDAPLGAFLSGGIDSSAVCHFLSQHKNDPLETYFIGFSPKDLKADVLMDERSYAHNMAERLASSHHEIEISSNGVESLVPKLIWHMDEPVGDPAAITTFLVSRAARESLTVLLSGVGGDELFAGYPRHLAMQMMMQFKKLPSPIQSMTVGLGEKLPGGSHSLLRGAKKFLRSVKSDELSSYLQMLSYFSPDDHKALFTPDFYDTYCKEDVYRYHRDYFDRTEGQPLLSRIQYVDAKTFLPCLNLTYTDRMSMAASIEVRVPLIDDGLFAALWDLPEAQKIKNRHRKYIFKKAMEPHLPHDVIWRKKTGFGAPIQAWINNEMKGIVAELLSPEHLMAQGIFNSDTIAALLKNEGRKKDYYANHIWQLITFQIWHHIFIDGDGSMPAY